MNSIKHTKNIILPRSQYSSSKIEHILGNTVITNCTSNFHAAVIKYHHPKQLIEEHKIGL